MLNPISIASNTEILKSVSSSNFQHAVSGFLLVKLATFVVAVLLIHLAVQSLYVMFMYFDT